MPKKAEIEEKEIEAPYELPEGWKWVRLGDVCKFENGYAFKSDNFSDKGTPVIRITNIKENTVDLESCVFTTETNIDNRFCVLDGDLLIAMSGATTGKTGVFKGTQIAYLNQRVGNIKIIDKTLLCEQFRNYYIQGQEHTILLNAYGGAQPNISSNKICEMYFPLPTLAEQQRIVNRIESMFAKLDEAKEKAQNVVDSFETRKAAILHQAFTGTLTAKWRKENGISDDSWREKTLGELCAEIKIGPFGSLLHEEDYIENGIPLVNPKHISNLQIFPDSKVSISEKKAEELASYKIYENDIVLGRRGEMGRCAPVGKKENGWLCGTGSMILRLKPEYLASIYSLFISSHASVVYLEENAVGSTLKNLNEKIVKSLPLPAISVPEQQEIVRILDTVLEKEHTAKSAAEQILEQIDLLKKSILARAFRGKL